MSTEEKADRLHTTFLQPYDDRWLELTLDLGAPLGAEWQIAAQVYCEYVREDLPYSASEIVVLQDWKRPEDNYYISDEDLVLFSPVYVVRHRCFLFDHKPTRDDVAPISPLFPDGPFLELKRTRYKRDGAQSLTFRFEKVPPVERQEQFLRHLKWWEVLAGRGDMLNDRTKRGNLYSPKTAEMICEDAIRRMVENGEHFSKNMIAKYAYRSKNKLVARATVLGWLNNEQLEAHLFSFFQSLNKT